jgi:hypothetical protein
MIDLETDKLSHWNMNVIANMSKNNIPNTVRCGHSFIVK